MKIRYEANNGKLFNTEEECMAYETSLNSLENNILIWDSDGDRISLDNCLNNNDESYHCTIDDTDIFFMQIKSEFAFNWLKELADKDYSDMTNLDGCIYDTEWLSNTEAIYILSDGYTYQCVHNNPLNFDIPLCKIFKEIKVNQSI